MTQSDMFDGAGRPTERPLTNREKFQQFHEDNPHVYEAIVEEAMDLWSRGRRMGIAAIVEHLRYSHMKTTGEEYKICNTHRAYYARMVMENVTELEGFFILREQTAKD